MLRMDHVEQLQAADLGRAVAERVAPGAIRVQEAAVGGDRLDQVGRSLEQIPITLLGLLERALHAGALAVGRTQLLDAAAQLHQVHGLARERAQHFALLGGQLARHAVDHAHRAERVPVRGQERCPRIEAHVRRADHQSARREARVFRRVLDHQHVVRPDRVAAERARARRRGHVPADARLRPLLVDVDQAHQRDRRAADVRSDPREVVEALLGSSAEDLVALERGKPGAFVD